MRHTLKFAAPLVLLATLIAARMAWVRGTVTVSFSNQSHLPAQVFQHEGSELRRFLDLQPGETRQLETSLGRLWVIKNDETTHRQAVTKPDDTIMLTTVQPVVRRNAIVDPDWLPRHRVGTNRPPRETNIPEINRQVASHARSLLGQRVGNGQCTELAVVSLQAAGARPGQSYVWGLSLSSPSELHPGDIIQMFNASFTYPDGRRSWSNGPHTAIVVGVEGDEIQVLEQNVAGSPVQEGSYDVRYLTAGTMKYYRPAEISGDSLSP